MPKVVDFLLQCPHHISAAMLCSENRQGRCHLSKARKETGVFRLLSSDTSRWRYGMSLQAVLGGGGGGAWVSLKKKNFDSWGVGTFPIFLKVNSFKPQEPELSIHFGTAPITSRSNTTEGKSMEECIFAYLRQKCIHFTPAMWRRTYKEVKLEWRLKGEACLSGGQEGRGEHSGQRKQHCKLSTAWWTCWTENGPDG